MPYTNVPADKTEKMDSCVEQVKGQGFDEQAAIAICYRSVVEAVDLDRAIEDYRLSAAAQDVRAVQSITATQDIILSDSSGRDTLAVKLDTDDPTGHVWEITIMGPETPSDVVTIDGAEYVRSANDRFYAVRAMEEATPLFEGAKSYDDHLTDEEYLARHGMRPPNRDWLATVVKPRWDAVKRAIVGIYKVVDDTWANKLLRAKQLNVLNTIGLSVDVDRQAQKRTWQGRTIELVPRILRVNSIDAVGNPAMGGRFARALESINSQTEGNMEELMKQIEQLMAAIDASMLPDEAKAALKAELEKVKSGAGEQPQEGVVEEAKVQEAKIKVAALASIAQRQIEAVKAKQPDPVAEATRILNEAKAEGERARAEAARIIEAAKAAEATRAFEAALSASGLTDKAKAAVRLQFEGGVPDPEKVKRAIEAQRAALLDVVDQSGRVAHHARPLISVGRVTEADRFELAFLRMMAGSTRFEMLLDSIDKTDAKGRPVFKALRESGQLRAVEAYVADGKPALPRPKKLSEWYYDFSDDDYMGIGQFGARALEANLTTATLASIVKNAVNVLLAANYSVRQQWWQDIVFEEDVDTIDDATLVRVFGVSTLPIVAEGAPYTELDMEDEEETATFFKRGGYIGVTLETFLRDKLNQLREIPNKLSNAWYNTISSRVAAVFTVNTAAGPQLADTGALFNATAATSAGGHANLLTTALSHAAWDAVVVAMKKQTDQPLGAGERLGPENKPGYLLVPTDLVNTALQIRNGEYVPGSANLTLNQYKGTFEVVEVPAWTDTNNWAALAKPSNMSPIHLIWLRGRRTPELFTADAEENGAMFTNDTLRYKVRQFGAEFSATYACAPVADWRSMHKNNVT